MAHLSSRHRWQRGTTLIELIVSVGIISLALLLLVGAFSTSLIQSTLVKRTTAANAASEYEVERIAAATYTAAPQPYSECFTVDTSTAPTLIAYHASCPAGASVRADVTETNVQPGLQQWTVSVMAYPNLSAVGSPISVYKTQR
jgi:Tfp pilus assembly protein PilE